MGRGRRELQRVLDQVREHALDLHRVDVHERTVADDVDAIAAGQVLHGLAHELVERPDLRLRLGAARLEAREVEQVADEPGEPLGVDGDRVEELAAVLVGEDERLAAQRADRRRDPGQRRAEVVRDGAEQRRLDEVAAAQRLGLERLLLEAAAVERHGEQRGQRRQEPVPHAEVRVRVGRHVERADTAALDLERDRRVRAAARRRPSSTSARSIPSTAAVCSPTQPSSASSGWPPSRWPAISASSDASRSRCSASAARRRDRAASSLTTSAVTVYTASANQFVESPQRERVRRRQEEEVEREHARDRDRQRPGDAPGDRDRQHREHVEHTEAERRRERFERPDEQRGDVPPPRPSRRA